VYNIYEKVR